MIRKEPHCGSFLVWKMENFRLPYIEIDEENSEVIYLGYPLPLTNSEYEVFRIIFYSSECVSKEDIVEKLYHNTEMSVESVPVHIHNINKKSTLSGGRKIIGIKKKSGYFIAENP